LVEPQNQGSTVCEWFGLKTTWTIFAGLASKPVAKVLAVWPQNQWWRFSPVWPSKLVATVSPGLASKLVVGFFVEPQNQGGGGFPGLGLKTGIFALVI
jgi:hypothetical protein